jgi:transposase, IS5 family
MELVSLNTLISPNHSYRKFLKLLDFSKLTKDLDCIKQNSVTGRKGYQVEEMFKMILLQFLEDLSDRQLSRYLAENMAAKYFCGFSINEKTPGHSLFGQIREKIGTSRLSKIFEQVRAQLKSQGVIKEIFTFVDASSLMSKLSTWEERDRAIKEGEESLNNELIERHNKKTKASHNKNKKTLFFDKDARYGSKSKTKFWFGYKRNASVDMQSGLINKIAITHANVGDDKAVKHILPDSGAVFADKGYCTAASITQIKKKGLHDCTIKKANMKCKNKDKDQWISKMRSPYEGTFSRMNKRTRYSGIRKNQFAEIMHAFSFNLKRLVVINAQPLAF